MNEYSVDVERTFFRSSRTKQKITSMTKLRASLNAMIEIIVQERVFEAFLSSSNICVATSESRRESTGATISTRQDNSVLSQSPSSLSCVNTALASKRGAKTQSEIMMTKNSRT